MGFMQTWGLAPAPKPKLEASFNLNEKRNTTNLKKAVANLSYQKRQEFLKTLKESGNINKTLSNRKILKVIDDEYGHKFRDEIKNKVLTHYQEPEVSEEEIQRHVAATVYQRQKEERDKGISQVSIYNKPAVAKQPPAKPEDRPQPTIRRPI